MNLSGQLSRRRYLQASAGISLAWGGLRLLADSGPSAAMRNPIGKEFFYGTAFYRPPNPPRRQRRDMLKSIAQDHGFNIIRIYPGWDYYNPAPDRFVFDDVDEVLGWCDEFKIKVLMGLVLETAPWWLEQAHPEARYVDAKGSVQRLQGSGNNMTGGWPGLCLDWPVVRDAAGRYIQALARLCSSHASFYAYDCWNEPHIEPAWQRNIWALPQERLFCYCDRTVEAFHSWLQKRYGSLDRLNEVWIRRYPSWKAIDPPRAMGTYMDWVDWRRFIIDRSTEELRFRVQQLRAADPSHVMEDHAAHHPPIDAIAVNGVNCWRLAEVVETWGLSLFPRWFDLPVFEGAAKFEITRSCAAGKEFWMTELQGGHGNKGLWRSPKMRPRDIRLWNWLAAASGAKGVIYWTYHAEGTGSEASGFGLVDRSGAPTERVEEASRNRALIQAHWNIIKDHLPKPEVALLTDQDSALLTFAMNGQEGPSTESFKGYYRALWNLDLWADFIEPEELKTASYKVIIAPWHLMGKESTCRNLALFVERGGILVLETAFGLFDEGCFYNPVVPPHGLAEMFGYREQESFYLTPQTNDAVMISSNASASRGVNAVAEEDQVYRGAEIEVLEPIRVRIPAHTFLTPITVTSAQPIARYRDLHVGARKAVGKGTVYYLGTNFGASLAAGGTEGIELLRAILYPAVKPKVSGEHLRPRLIEGQSNSLLAVFNDRVEEQMGRIELPKSVRRVKDIHTQQEIGVEANAIRIVVPHQDVRVFLLE
ncbi:MAG: beta-galactosidase [Acidobacteriota bacterium]